jgi:hypothetical protein
MLDNDCGAIGGMQIGRGIWSTSRNLRQRHFDHYESHMTWMDYNTGRCGGKPATNRLSYGTAFQIGNSRLIPVIPIPLHLVERH